MKEGILVRLFCSQYNPRKKPGEMKVECVWDVGAHERNNCFYYDSGTIYVLFMPNTALIPLEFIFQHITPKRGELEIAGN